MDVASLASSLVMAQTAQTQQSIGIAVQKSNAESQQAIADLLTTQTAAAAPSSPSANSAITGRGQVLDISV